MFNFYYTKQKQRTPARAEMCRTISRSAWYKALDYLFALSEMGGGKTLALNGLYKPLGFRFNILPFVNIFLYCKYSEYCGEKQEKSKQADE